MTWVRQTIAVGLVAPALALVSFGCGGSTENKAGGASAPRPLVLTVANPTGAPEELDTFVSEVNRLSGGSLKLDVISRWRWGQVGFETGVIKDVQAGKADIGIAGARAWDTVGDKSFEALTAPTLISSYVLQEKVLASPLASKMLASLGGLGLTGLGISPGQLRYPFGIGRPLLGPSDYRGKTLGVSQSSVATATFQALGASVRDVPAGGPITGLTGLEDGVSYWLGNDRSGGYLTGNVVLWPRPMVIFANSARLARLTDKQRQILATAASDVQAQTSWLRNDSAYAASTLCRAGRTRVVEATPGDIAALRSAMRPVYASLDRTASTRAFISNIEAIRGTTGSEPALTCAANAAAAAAKPGQLDGVYQFRVTAKDMIAAHADPSEIIPVNLGATVYVFDRGRFADTQVYGPACTWGYGKVTFTPTTLTLTFADGGGMSPKDGFSKPGEQFTYDWSLYHDVLTLKLPPNTGGPTPLHAVPWQRVSTTPSTSYFPKRCPPPANALPR